MAVTTTPKVSATDKALDTFADLMIEKIQSLRTDWKKPWFSEGAMTPPRNLSGRYYNGCNSFMLMLQAEKKGYELPIWGTFDRFVGLNYSKDKQGAKKRLTDANGDELPKVSITKGEKSFPVFITTFTCVNPETKEKIKYDDYKQLSENDRQKYNVFPKLSVYYVFNVAQTNLAESRPELYEKLKEQCGIKPKDVNENRDMSSHPAIDAMIDKNLFLCPINQVQGDDAYYSISKDHIVIPLRSQFKDGESFASNTLHECAHALGAEGRLNRIKPTSFGSNAYGREELVAEMTAALVSSHFGLSKHVKEDSCAYLKSWLDNIKEDTSFIKTVLNDVKKASAMLEARILEVDSALKADDMIEFMKQGFDAYHESKVNKAI